MTFYLSQLTTNILSSQFDFLNFKRIFWNLWGKVLKNYEDHTHTCVHVLRISAIVKWLHSCFLLEGRGNSSGSHHLSFALKVFSLSVHTCKYTHTDTHLSTFFICKLQSISNPHKNVFMTVKNSCFWAAIVKINV